MANLCTNCLAGTLEESGGVYVCSNCGFQANVTVETTEFQPGVDDVGWRRRAGGSVSVRMPTLTIEQQEQQAAQKLTEAAFLYAQCIQLLLQAQATALVSNFQCPPVVESVLRQLWLSLLPATQLLEPDFARDPSSHSRGGGAGSDGDTGQATASDTDEDTDGADGQEEQQMSVLHLVKPHVLKKALWKAFPPAGTLQLCWLACHIMRLAVSPWDVADWAHTGLLPYLQWLELCRPMLQAGGDWPPAALPVACLQPSRVGKPDKLLPRALALVQQVDLPQPLPPVNGEAWLLRTAVELQLPQVVLVLALDLYVRHLLGTPALQLDQSQRGTAGSSPFVVPHTAVLVALKLLYGLGQVQRQSGGGAGLTMGVGTAPPVSLQQKLEQVEKQHRALHEQLQQLRQGSPLPGAGAAGPQEGSSSRPSEGGSAAQAQPEAVDWVAWAAAARQRILGASSSGVGPGEVLQWPTALRAAYLQFYHEVVCAGKTPPAGLQQIHDMVCGWGASALPDDAPAEMATEGGAAESATAALPSPASAVGVQARAAMYQLNKMALPAATPDYVAVLVLLAAHCHVAPRVLHELALRLEQQLQATEAVLRPLIARE